MSDKTFKTGLSDYEMLRMQNIERNRDFLNNLGIDNDKRDMHPKMTGSAPAKKRRKILDSTGRPSMIPEELMRRSVRLSALPPADYKDSTNIIEAPQRPSRVAGKKKGTPPPPAANSTKSLIANLDPFLAEVLFF